MRSHASIARDVAHAELGELRDFFEPAHLLVGVGARFAHVVERELVEVDEAAPVAALAEVVDVARERFLVRRVDAECLVQQLCCTVAIAEVLARDRRELEDLVDEHVGRRVRILAERVDLGLHQLRQLFPLLVVVQQLLELVGDLAARLLVRDQLGQHFDQAVAVLELAAIQRGAPAQHFHALARLGDDHAAVAQVAVELVPLRRLRQRALERLRCTLCRRVDANRAAQVVDAGRVVARLEALAAELDEQLAGLVPGLSVAERRIRVDLGERLGELDRARIEAVAFLEVIRRRLEILRAQRQLAELEAQMCARRASWPRWPSTSSSAM